MDAHILVVDDEKTITDLVGIYLKNEGYQVTLAYTGADAAREILTNEFDLAVLDIMLPDVDGFELLRTIRNNHTYPVIMLTARDSQTDKIEGLSLGADDYVVKPFRPLELVARVKAQLRRYTKYGARGQAEEEASEIGFNGLVINRDSRSVMVDGALNAARVFHLAVFGREPRARGAGRGLVPSGVGRGVHVLVQQHGDGAYPPSAREDRRRRAEPAFH